MNKKIVVVTIVFLIFFATLLPIISGLQIKNSDQTDLNLETENNPQENVVVTFYTFGLQEQSAREVEMPRSEIDETLTKINEYSTEIAYDSQSEKAQQLQQEIFTKTQELGILPESISTKTIQTEYNPLINIQNTRGIPVSILQNRASAFFCNFATTGTGSQFPIIIFPRLIPIIQLPIPRAFLHWTASDGYTSCGGLLSGKGFIASGEQKGTALGFWGIGFSVFLPPIMQYGFIGYALFVSAEAEEIELWPPNNPPEVIPINPHNGEIYVPLSMSELQFEISDQDGDLMSYKVTTTPDIGSGSGNIKPDGLYTVPINGLEYDDTYIWSIEVSDGEEMTQMQFSFSTVTGPPFDPFGEGWQYRKEITIDHTKVAGDIWSFPMLISSIDSDLRDKAQADGYDILFMDSSSVANKFFHEIEYYNHSSGELIAWINMPKIESNSDTSLYLYYGNPNCPIQQIPEKTWDLNYKMVHHMNGLTANCCFDSTANDNDVTNSGGTPDYQKIGQIGHAINFELSGGEYLSIPASPSLDITDQLTMSLWFNPPNGTGPPEIMGLCGRWDTEANKRAYTIYTSGTNKNLLCGAVTENGAYISGERSKSGSLENELESDTWQYIIMTYNPSSQKIELYKNGDNVVDRYNYVDANTVDVSDISFLIGAHYETGTPYRFTNGFIDEVRVSNIIRNQAWISTEYNNQNEPSSFYSVGPEEHAP